MEMDGGCCRIVDHLPMVNDTACAPSLSRQVACRCINVLCTCFTDVYQESISGTYASDRLTHLGGALRPKQRKECIENFAHLLC